MLNQRWRGGRASYRRPTEPIRPSEYDVALLADDTTPRAFVCAHHYSATYPAARWRVGLYRRGDLAGVAVFSHPANDVTLTSVFPGHALDSVELGRFVLLDEVPGNGESWFLARCFELLRRDHVRGVVAFSDPVPRRSDDHRLVFRGHIGTIYQASNGGYLGRGTARTLHLLADGTVLNARTLQKIRAGERGWRAAAGRLEDRGAPSCPSAATARRAWLHRWLPQVTRRLAHPGNHKYAWPLTRRDRLPQTFPYPKFHTLPFTE